MDRETLKLKKSTSKMNYATHGFHRYYGKLPSEVYGHIFGPEMSFAELMCGSGTGLVEGLLAGKSVIGVDSNPLAILISKAKTTPIDPAKLRLALKEVLETFSECALPPKNQTSLLEFTEAGKVIGMIREDEVALDIVRYAQEAIPNFDHWFSAQSALELGLLRSIIDRIDNDDIRWFLLACYSSIVRRVSNASTRAGKLFHIGRENDTPVQAVFRKKTEKNIQGMEEFVALIPNDLNCRLLEVDARNTSLDDKSQDLVICHPPYFALYRYSAIYRLEFGWLGYERSSARRNEIEEGFKATDTKKYDIYINDMVKVIEEANRILANGGRFCLVVGNSSLRDVHLPAVTDLQRRAITAGFRTTRVVERIIEGSQAVYHPSTKAKMKRETDCLIFFEKIRAV